MRIRPRSPYEGHPPPEGSPRSDTLAPQFAPAAPPRPSKAQPSRERPLLLAVFTAHVKNTFYADAVFLAYLRGEKLGQIFVTGDTTPPERIGNSKVHGM